MKKINLGIIAIIVIIIAGNTIAVGAASYLIQATLAQDISVKYNGNLQTLKDVNGNVVYPISYNGTTYLPVRAVANMLNIEVNYDDATKTVLLGSVNRPPESTLTVGKLSGDRANGISGESNLPQRENLGNITDGYVRDSYNLKALITFEKAYKKLSFIAYAQEEKVDENSSYKYSVSVYSAKDETVLYKGEISLKEFLDIKDIDITGMESICIEIKGISSRYNLNPTLYILNPRVRD